MIRKIWENTFKEGGELLEFINEEIEQIVGLFMADKIDLQVFLSNLETLLRVDNPSFNFLGNLLETGGRNKTAKPASYSILHPPKTRSHASFWSRINRPVGIPLWFLAAYPDVMVWLDEQQEKYCHNTDDEIAELKLFGIKKAVPNENMKDFENSKGKIRSKYLKNLVQSYKDTTGKEPETAVKSLEDNIYAGADFLKILGTESNFTFIAENTTKYYLELSKNYGDKFDNEVTLLATAGILDAQVYIFMEQVINPLEILDIAKKVSEARRETLVNFIISLEVKLLGTDTPNMNIDDVKEACEGQRQNIEKAVQKVKDEYDSEPRFDSDVANFMQLPQFKPVRELIGIKE